MPNNAIDLSQAAISDENTRVFSSFDRQLRIVRETGGAASAATIERAAPIALTRDPLTQGTPLALIPVFTNDKDMFGSLGITESTRRHLGWPRIDPVQAIEDGADSAPIMEALCRLYQAGCQHAEELAARQSQASSTARRDIKRGKFPQKTAKWDAFAQMFPDAMANPQADKDNLSVSHSRIVSYACELATVCLSVALDQHHTLFTAQSSLRERFMRRKDVVSSMQWNLKLWEAIGNKHDIFAPGDELGHLRLSVLVAAFSKDIESDEERLKLIADSQTSVEQAYKLQERYERSPTITPLFKWRPVLSIHQVEAMPGFQAEALHALNTCETAESHEFYEETSIAKCEYVRNQFEEQITVQGNYAVIQDLVIPTFEEYRARMHELAGKVVTLGTADERNLLTNQVRCGLKVAIAQLTKEINNTLALTEANFTALSQKFNKRASASHKRLLQEMHDRTMQNETDAEHRARKLVDELTIMMDSLQLETRESKPEPLREEKQSHGDRALPDETTIEKSDQSSGTLDPYTLRSLIMDMTRAQRNSRKDRKKRSKQKRQLPDDLVEVDEAESEEERVTLTATGRDAVQSLRNKLTVIRFEDPEQASSKDNGHREGFGLIPDTPVPDPSTTGRVSDRTVLISANTDGKWRLLHKIRTDMRLKLLRETNFEATDSDG